jgi:hypothetical protein
LRTGNNSCGIKIFGIGNGWTGTRSLVAAAGLLGYELLHRYEGINYDELNAKDGGTDNAFAARFIELDRKYPGSRFIYTSRELDSWLDACKRRIHNKTPCKVGSAKFRTRVMMYGYDLGLGYRENLLIDAFTKHQTKVMDYFKDRPQDLLILNITEGEGWEKLCPFLDMPIPNHRFPHRGKSR